MRKTRVRAYTKRKGTHVKSHVRRVLNPVITKTGFKIKGERTMKKMDFELAGKDIGGGYRVFWRGRTIEEAVKQFRELIRETPAEVIVLTASRE